MEKEEKVDKARKYIDDIYREAMLAINHANDLVKWYTTLRLKYNRVCFMMETNIPFLVVKWEEPYAKTVFDLIRDNETKEGRWNNLDEINYQKFLLLYDEKGDLK